MVLREFLDLAGLNYYDEEIKKLIKSNDTILAQDIKTLKTALIGEVMRSQGIDEQLSQQIADLIASSATKEDLEWGALGAE